MAPLGLIAGNGVFPLLFARAARAQGYRLVAAACEGETDPALAGLVDECEWVRLGQLGRLCQVFTSRQVTQVVLAGGIASANLFKNLSLDLRMIAVAARLKVRNAATLFGALAEELGKDGVQLLDPRPFLGEHIPAVGVLGARSPDAAQQEDIAFGLGIARSVSALDIGQTVVVKRGTVLAVEALEGSDECLRRGGALAGEKGGAVAVKVAKARHDFRFDIPCIGPRTIESCVAGQVAVLAVEAGRTLLLDREAVLAAANQHRLVVVGA